MAPGDEMMLRQGRYNGETVLRQCRYTVNTLSVNYMRPLTLKGVRRVELRRAGNLLEEEPHNVVVVDANVARVELNVVNAGQGRDFHHFAGCGLNRVRGLVAVIFWGIK